MLMQITKKKYVIEHTPDLLVSIYKGVFYKDSFSMSILLKNIEEILGNAAVNEFINLHSDEGKLDLILSRPTVEICLPTQTMIDIITKRGITDVGMLICNAVICNNHDLFEFLLGIGTNWPRILTYFLVGLSKNRKSVDWFYELPIRNYRMALEIVRDILIPHPDLIASVSNIAKNLMDKSGMSNNQIAEYLIFTSEDSKVSAFASCEMLNVTNLFDYEYFKELSKTNVWVKEWLDLTSQV